MKGKMILVLLLLTIAVSLIFCVACSKTYKITYTTDGNGTIEGETIQKLSSGEQSTTVTAVPNEGYEFIKWSDENTDASRTDIVEGKSLKLTAIFERCKYNVSYEATYGSFISGPKNQTIEHGGDADSVEVVILYGYRFLGWSDTGSKNPRRQDMNVTSNITATAMCEVIRIDKQWVEYITDGNGTIKGEAKQLVTYDESATAVTAIPNEGYEFVQWSDGVTTAERQDLNVTEPMTITAQFKRIFIRYNLNCKLGENDTGITDVTFYDNDFKTVDFPVPTRELFTFGGWYIGDKQVTDKNGKMTIGEELLESEGNEIYANWTANENYTYKILMVYVTELDAEITSVRGNGDIDVYYKMSDFDIEICKKITLQVRNYLNEMMDGLVTFEVDEYFTTVPVGSESIAKAWMNQEVLSVNLIYACNIPEIYDSGICKDYQSVLTVFCMDDYDHEFRTAAGVATIKYGCIYLETVYGESILNNESLDYLLNTDFWRWRIIVGTFLHELAHTIEMRIDGAFDYHKYNSWFFNEYMTNDEILMNKLYYLNVVEINGEKVGIPLEYWKGELEVLPPIE